MTSTTDGQQSGPRQIIDALAAQHSQSSLERFPVIDPSTEEVITHVARMKPRDAQAAVDAAAQAGPGWAATAPRERGEILRRAYELMIARRDEIAHLISLEMGKALRDAVAEVSYAAEFFRWFSEEAVRIGGETRLAPSGGSRILTLLRPVGIALLITPWNFPAAMATRKLAPALAAGCTALLKPATDTPLTALLIHQLLCEAGLPTGVVNVVTTDQPRDLVSSVLGDNRVRKLSFTGSTEVGRILLRQAAEHILNTSMELGGNAAFIVLEDANLTAAADGALIAKARNGGQACTAANRFLVHHRIADTFTDLLSERMSALRIGPGTAADTQLGPLVNQNQLSAITDRVNQSVAAGANIRLGAHTIAQRGYYYPATILTDVPPTAPASAQEIFGPVASITPIRDDNEAIHLANDTEMGLATYLYTQDLQRALNIAGHLETGMLGINRGLVSEPAAPFGGVKQSGLGREGGQEGIKEYLETTYIATDR